MTVRFPVTPRQLAGPVNRFAADVAASQEDAGEGLVFSPAGMWAMLAGLSGLAEPAAAGELAAVCRIAQWQGAEGARMVLAELEASTSASAAVGMWVSDLVGELPDAAAGWFGPATVNRLTGDLPADAAAVAEWVAERSAVPVPAPVELSAQTLLAVVSVVSADTVWERPFIDTGRGPAEGPWAGLEGVAVLSRMAPAADSPVRVVDGDHCRFTLVTVAGAGDVDVHLAISDPDVPAGQLIADAVLAAGAYPDEAAAPWPQQGPAVTFDTTRTAEPVDGGLTVLKVPKFSVTAKINMLAPASRFGLSSASDNSQGRFPGLSADPPLYVAAAGHAARAEFTSEGFRASAVTAMSLLRAAGIPRRDHETPLTTVTFDRPFAFVAADRRSGMVLFAGWVADPTDPQPSSTGERR